LELNSQTINRIVLSLDYDISRRTGFHEIPSLLHEIPSLLHEIPSLLHEIPFYYTRYILLHTIPLYYKRY
jgi:hypothetical protein